ncbi:NAD(P)H-dependent oxidoreductase [Rhizobium rhizogenes]
MNYGSSIYDATKVARDEAEAEPFAKTPSKEFPPQLDIDPDTEKASFLPNILILVGSIRHGSASAAVARLVSNELGRLGSAVEIFDPTGLPVMSPDNAQHPKVAELRRLVKWSEGQVWISPEYHGGMSGLLKTQIDWIPVAARKLSWTYGKVLALMQVCGGQQSFNAVNQMRLTARWLHMLALPNQLSVPAALEAIGPDGSFVPISQQERLCDICTELLAFVQFTRQRRLVTDTAFINASSAGQPRPTKA